MKRTFIPLIGLLAFILIGCSKSDKISVLNNQYEGIAKAVVDSVLATTPDITLDTISFLKTRMPALMADELQQPMQKAGEALAVYILAGSFSKDNFKDEAKKKEFAETLIQLLKPCREKINEYNKTSTKQYIFGLAKLHSSKNSTKTIKKIFILNGENPKVIEKVKDITTKPSEYIMSLQLCYGNIDELIGSQDLILKNKEVAENPIYQFIIEE